MLHPLAYYSERGGVNLKIRQGLLVLLLITMTYWLSACDTTLGTAKQVDAPETHADHQGGHSTHAGEHQQDAVETTWTFDEGKQLQAGGKSLIRLAISDKDGKPIEQFDINHEKKLHLIVVSKDLSFFEHVHPQYMGQGVFQIEMQFPAGGDYKLFADFIPTGAAATTQSEWVSVSGSPVESVPIVPEQAWSSVVDGKLITLETTPLVDGESATLSYTIRDGQTEEPITDLQPYLGAVGHVVILDEQAERYLHVHPMDEQSSGPEAKFMTTFPEHGIYKVWAQFQHHDRVFTVPFVVNVP